MSIRPVKDRDPYAAGEVCVYRNLKPGGHTWSIAAVKGNDNRGLLLGHADTLALVGARMVVKQSRRQAIEAGGYREVCAWIVGKIADPHIPHPRRVTFWPRERAYFFTPDDGCDVHTADAVTFDADGNAYI